jgi:hypothetical protein
MDDGAADWGEGERKAWVWAYLAGLPVQLPLAEHRVGECGHCDALRELVAHVDKLLAELSATYCSPN